MSAINSILNKLAKQDGFIVEKVGMLENAICNEIEREIVKLKV